MGKHAEWRKLAKKARRKLIRKARAKVRNDLAEKEQKRKEASPTYQKLLEEQRKADEFQAEEERRISIEENEKWLQRERESEQQWRELQKKLAVAREERQKQITKIKEEWEREQKRLQKLREEKEREVEQRRLEQEKLQKTVEDFIENGGETPPHLQTCSESNPNKEICPFFKKTFACRFGNTCSRNHVKPAVSRIILIQNFYSHISLDQTENEHGSDSSLEFENRDTYKNFKEFFNDVVPEMEKCGEIITFKVCCNHSPHLRGNVYVEYSQTREAIKSYRLFNGRYYAGKQLQVEFCKIDSWKAAICGLSFSKNCPKGTSCNFLHVFMNPYNLFSSCLMAQRPDKREKRNWRWSESPESDRSSVNWEDTALYQEKAESRHSKHHQSKRKSTSHRKSSYSEKRSRSGSRSSSRRKKHREERDVSRSPEPERHQNSSNRSKRHSNDATYHDRHSSSRSSRKSKSP